MRAFVALIAVLLVAGCQTVDTTKGGTVGVDRHQRMAVSSEEVNAGAQKAYAQMMAQAQKKNALDRDAAQVARIKNIVGRLVPQTTAFRDDAGKWPWEVHVISVDDVNAWCMPAGKMAIYTGLINKLQATDDELAAVMGHEIAHALREHSREQMSQQAITQTGIGIVGAIFGVGELGQGVANAVADVTLFKPKSRGMETEADRIGVELAARAGYDPACRDLALAEDGEARRQPAAAVAFDPPVERVAHRRPAAVLGESDAAVPIGQGWRGGCGQVGPNPRF
jgi:Zn-dependent protease with chaperone function